MGHFHRQEQRTGIPEQRTGGFLVVAPFLSQRACSRLRFTAPACGAVGGGRGPLLQEPQTNKPLVNKGGV